LKSASPYSIIHDMNLHARLSASISAIPDRGCNRILAAIPEEQWRRWAPHLEALDMPTGKVLADSGTLRNHVYFPATAIVSLRYATEDGASAEVAAVGNEGMVGLSLFLGGGSTLSHAVVRNAGWGLRLDAQVAMHALRRSGATTDLFLRYTHSLFTELSQTAACSRRHPVDQQLCRLLLVSLDALRGNELVMTHESIAEALGVRRESVTAAAGRLQTGSVIRYTRGQIEVLDRQALEKRVCECYWVVKTEHSRLLRSPLAAQPPHSRLARGPAPVSA
jgi:CRP-like cAMP-binding protein